MSTDNGRSDGARLPNGRFNVGNKEALGNPNNRRMHELRKAMLETATPEKVKAVGDKLYELAVAGDCQAISLWLSYILGKPTAAITITGEDGGPIATTSAAAVLSQSSVEITEWRKKMADQLLSLSPPTEEPDPTG